MATTALALNGGTIRDAASNDATLTLAAPGAAGSLGANKAIVIDTTAPTVTNVTSSTATAPTESATTVAVQVTFSEAVTVTGTPQLTLETGATDAVVNYASGSGTTTLTFNYTVAAGHASADLDYVGHDVAGPERRHHPGRGQQQRLPDAAGARGRRLARRQQGDRHRRTSPTVTNVTSSTADGTYGVGATCRCRSTFSKAVTVTGTPQLTLETGVTDAVVNYASGSGTTTLTFTYTVAAGHTSPDLDYVATTSLALNGGTIRDAGSNDATLTLPAPGAAGSLGANKALVIDTIVPTVTDVTSATADGTYGVGATVSVQVVLSKVVNVTGTPQLTLETGVTDAVVNYASGSGTNTLTFTYTVAAGHASADLDYAATTSLALNGGTIRDVGSNDAILTLPAPGAAGSLGANKALVVDGVVPTVTNVTSSTADGAYTVGSAIALQVTFSEAVTVTGTPQLTLETGVTDAVVDYASGTGTDTLTFTYTVAAGHTSADLDYAATTSLALNGGSIRDAASNNATLTLAAPGAAGSLGANKAIVVDTTAPTVTNVTSSTANGTYGVSATVSVQVTFSEVVTVAGTPQLTLETGVTDAVVDYASGSGTSTLTYQLYGGCRPRVARPGLRLNRRAGAERRQHRRRRGQRGHADPRGTRVGGVARRQQGSGHRHGRAGRPQRDVVHGRRHLRGGRRHLGAGDVQRYGHGDGDPAADAGNRSDRCGGGLRERQQHRYADLRLQRGRRACVRRPGLRGHHVAGPQRRHRPERGEQRRDVDAAGARRRRVARGEQGAGHRHRRADRHECHLVDGGRHLRARAPRVDSGHVRRSRDGDGTPQLTLETGATDAVVNYSSGTGTNTLTFNYTIGARDFGGSRLRVDQCSSAKWRLYRRLGQ